jgi:hypothetical protein
MMIQPSKSKGALVVAGIAALMSISFAQHSNRKPDAFNTTMEGRGSVHFNGATYSFHQLQVTLQRNDRVTVHALLYASNNKDVVFTGKMSDFGRRTGRLSADIDAVGYGRDSDGADALCDIDMTSDRRFNTVTITGRNTTDHNNLSLDFVSNGHEITDFQIPNRDQIYDKDRGRHDRDHDRDRDRDHDNNNGRASAGHYVDMDEWRRNGEHFVVRYRLDLDRDGGAKMVVQSVEDRNMPDDRDARYDHGDVLKYLQHGQGVTQTGRWTQDGNNVTIRFDHIEYGFTSKRKDEVFRGHMRNGTIWIDDYEKSFYGHSVNLSFEAR